MNALLCSARATLIICSRSLISLRHLSWHSLGYTSGRIAFPFDPKVCWRRTLHEYNGIKFRDARQLYHPPLLELRIGVHCADLQRTSQRQSAVLSPPRLYRLIVDIPQRHAISSSEESVSRSTTYFPSAWFSPMTYHTPATAFSQLSSFLLVPSGKRCTRNPLSIVACRRVEPPRQAPGLGFPGPSERRVPRSNRSRSSSSSNRDCSATSATLAYIYIHHTWLRPLILSAKRQEATEL